MTEIPHVLVACTMDHAGLTARVDLGWELFSLPNRMRGALNKDGEFVRFTSRLDTLRGYRAEGRKLYLGYDWIFAHASAPKAHYLEWWQESGGEVVEIFEKHTGRQLIQSGEI